MTGTAFRVAMTSYYLPSESKIGAGWMAHRLANALADRGHSVTMFSPCRRPDDARYQHVLHRLDGRARTFRWAVEVRRLDLSDFDVLHAHGDDHLVRRHATPVHVRTLHGSCIDEAIHATGLKERLRMAMLGATEIVAAARVSDTVGVSAASLRWTPWRDVVVPNGVDVDLFRPGGEREAVPTILFVGTYRRRKRGRLLMDVFQEYVRPRVPDVRLWMVCSDAPEAPGVEVLGRLSDAELADRYRRAWVFCLPSSYEGFGVPYAEALASGTAVVASPNLGAREVLRDGRRGLVAGDDELGRSLVRALIDTTLRERLVEAGLGARQEYDWAEVARRYEAIYAERLAGRVR